ncbi:hypothetical protein FLX56_25055 [Synechococcus moorigangaii CMS01]|nr:hypothetical protein [Synechococcus moorigangaii CMS01]
MAIASKASRWCISTLIAVNLIGCTPWTVLSQQEDQQTITSLETLTSGAEVQIQGTVTQRVPLLEQGAYELEDDTGRIWVITASPLPEEGTTLAVSGQLQRHELQLQQEDFGELFIQEESHFDVVETSEAVPTQVPIKEHLDLQFLPHKEQEKD